MRKLLLIIAISVVSYATNAAAFKWTSGKLLAPNLDGTVSETTASKASGTWIATVTLYDDASCITAISGITGNSSSTVNIMTSAITGTFGGAKFEANQTYYAILELSYTTASGTQTLKTGAESITIKGTGDTSITFSEAVSSASWTAVPEPTSGLIMLLGLTGLALRRKLA